MVPNSYTPYQVYDLEPQADLRAMLLRYLRYWPWFVLSLVLALVAAYIYLLYQPPVYKVQASLLIKDEKKGISDAPMLKELDLFSSNKVVDNEMEILKSFTMMDRVAKKLGLDVRYYNPTSTSKKEIYGESPIRLIVEKANPTLYEEELTFTFPTSNTVQLNGQVYPINQSIRTPYGQLRIFTRKPLNNKLEPVITRVFPQCWTLRE
ncbi:Wzz/FepE/Etk N-terminal domain-containing protein [Spirosoma sp. SC4-14]|uniref:Wzz/FepE/Etk N-terminal domain-containing protein n=1 Tax=Spirosoma sp. SC4-14 TaxID=3128900 RepID=UPI0030D5DEBC